MKENEAYSSDEKKMMLSLARSTIMNALKKEKLPDPGALPEKLHEIRSCFVTLHSSDGGLRGCIGNIEAFEPLCENIMHNALNSAFGDPRFKRMKSLDELSVVHIEISVLTLPSKIKSPDEFVIGKHGIILLKDFHSSVFLPQVAPEQGWDLETTMVHLSLKAGLEPYAWKEPDVEFKVFEAVVFSEKQKDT
ncbi:MAG: hypothetical protein A2X48_23925 [Lentisphaerae bacterium GWF2_49_21]|nr:MAG: hypothetical protein A2X48_23925 [Lentisphaerae bacterium GWF2_49_21]